MGVVESRWAPRSSKPLRGAAEVALVGSTPIHSRMPYSKRPFQIQEGPLVLRETPDNRCVQGVPIFGV